MHLEIATLINSAAIFLLSCGVIVQAFLIIGLSRRVIALSNSVIKLTNAMKRA